jgi:sec-independent protein translocase protein TatC
LNTGNDDVEATIGVQTYIDTVTRLLLLNGIVFQMPFVIMGLAKIGIVTSRKLWKWKAYAIVGAVTLAAVVTPSIDPMTQAIVTVPILILYLMGMLFARMVEGNSFLASRARDFDS